MQERSPSVGRSRKTKQSTYKRLNSKLRRGSVALISSARRRSKGLSSKISVTNIHHTLPTPSEAEDNEPTMTKVSLYDKIDERLFKGELTGKKYADVIRTAHCISIETTSISGEKELCVPCDILTNESIPEKQLRQMSRMVLIIERLFVHFSKVSKLEDEEEKESIEEVTELIINHIYNFIERFKTDEIEKKYFNLTRLFSELSNYYATDLIDKVRSVLKFLHISVIIFAIEELRDKLDLGVEHLTRDVEWGIKIGLSNRLIDISHTRRESVLKQNGENNYWEIRYNVVLAFDTSMTKFHAVRLALKDLVLAEEMDEDLQTELNRKFFRGKFTVC